MGMAERSSLLKEINERICSPAGLPIGDFDQIRDDLVAPGWTAAEFIQTGLMSGGIKKQNGKFVLDLAEPKVKLDPKTEQALREMMAESKKGSAELVLGFIKMGLGVQD